MPRPRHLLLLASTLVLGVIVPVQGAVADTGPTATITSPAAGTSESGIVTITAVGDVAPTEPTDTATSLGLVVDGVPYGAVKACTATVVDSCTATLAWDSSGLSGQHTLQVDFVTGLHPGGTLSAPVTVTAVNPVPTIAVASPLPGQVVRGPLTVKGLAAVDLTQSDTTAAVQLFLDGAKYGAPQSCTLMGGTTPKTCDVSFTVPTTGLSGTHTVQLSLATAHATAVSAIVPYTVFTALKATLRKLAPVRGGKSVGIAGSVTAFDGGTGVAGVRVKITLTPTVGKARTLVVHTGATGRFSATVKIAVGTTIAASVARTSSAGTAYAVTKIAAYAPITCRISKTLVHRNDDVGTCVVPSLPNKTTVSLQYLSGKKWKTLGAGLTQGTAIPISFTFPKKGHYQIRLVLGANKAYLATKGLPIAITVT